MNLPVRTTPEVDAQIRVIDEWWRRDRESSPDLFLDELRRSFDILSAAPRIGQPYRRSPVPGARRVLLKGTRYHVYYVSGPEEVRVLTLWHAQRGTGPPLRAL